MKFFLSVAFFAFYGTVIPAQDFHIPYTSVKNAENVWTIVESNTVNIYVVAGNDSALIIDTGYGTGDLNSYVKSLTGLPVIVVNTHGHDDHVGGDAQFSKVWLHSDDFAMFKYSIEQAGKEMQMPELGAVKEGYVFDLGGRKLQVYEVPGHTHGSIILIDKVNKIMFAGDNTNALVWLFLKDCYPLEVYLESLKKAKSLKNDYDIIMPGHHSPLDKNFIDEQIICVENILNGTCTAEPYDYSDFTKGAMKCTYKTAEVTYDPQNLFVKGKN